MFARIALLAATLALMPSLAPAQEKPPQTTYMLMGSPIDWKLDALVRQYVYTDQLSRDWTVTLKPQGKVEGKPKYLKMTVSREGIKPVSTAFDLEASADYGTLGVYDFDAQTPTFLMTNFSLGAHCCTDVKAVVFNGQKLVATDAGSYDGSSITVRDLDGDGTYEMEGWDQRFYYAFDSYGGSLPARQILKLRETGVVDVTDSIDYQAYLVGQINELGNECYEKPSAGICAGLLGTAAKAGLYQSAAADVDFKKIDADNPGADYLDCSAEKCGVQMKFWNFREALEFQLGEWGYKTESSLNDRARSFFGKLAAFRKGFGTPRLDNNGACETEFKVTLDKAGRFAQIEGNEYSCRVEKANVLDNAAIGLGLCQGEGESYSTLLFMELKRDTLSMNWLYKGSVDAASDPSVMPACR